MAAVVYLSCALTAFACAALLLRGYARNKVPLLLWSGVCFACMGLENVGTFVDLVLYPELPLAVYRDVIGLVGIIALLRGLVWESR
jgi:hypothetical protein